MVPMKVAGLIYCSRNQRPVMLLEDLGRQFQLGLVIPTEEADRLARVLGMTPCSCTPIYALVDNLILAMGAVVDHVVLEGKAEGVASTLVLRQGGVENQFSCHPVDAVALALRAGAAILATEEALRGARAISPLFSSEEMQGWLEKLRPADFGEK